MAFGYRPIVGIVVGSIGFILVFYIVNRCLQRRRIQRNMQQAPPQITIVRYD